MASNSGWSKDVPSGLSQVALGDDEIRSFKSYMQAWWEAEHYATGGSTTSAGIHRQGSARGYVGTASQLSNPTGDNVGKLMYVTDTKEVRVASGSTWNLPATRSPGVFSDVTSIFTVVAASTGAAAGGGASFNLVNPDGTRFHMGDTMIASVASRLDLNGDEAFIPYVRMLGSGASVNVVIHNVGSSRLTVLSGTTISVLGFRLNTVVP